MESYLLGSGDIEPTDDKWLEGTICAVHASQETLVQAVSELTKRMERLEEHGFKEAPTRPKASHERQYHEGSHRRKVVCWKCGQVGHYAHGCAATNEPLEND